MDGGEEKKKVSYGIGNVLLLSLSFFESSTAKKGEFYGLVMATITRRLDVCSLLALLLPLHFFDPPMSHFDTFTRCIN